MEPTIVVAVIGAVAGLSTTGLSLWQRKRLSEVRDEVKSAHDTNLEVHAEVKNSHETNLRDDMDRVLEKLDHVINGQARQDEEIADIRDDQRLERQERMALAARMERRRH